MSEEVDFKKVSAYISEATEHLHLASMEMHKAYREMRSISGQYVEEESKYYRMSICQTKNSIDRWRYENIDCR